MRGIPQAIAEYYGVSRQAVLKWIKNGLKHTWVQEEKRKAHMIIDTRDVEEYKSSRASRYSK